MSRSIEDRNKRKKYGLPPVIRYPKIDDPVARNVNQLTAESDFLNLDTTVSTSPDQIAIAPGYLQKEWTANGRRYFRYKNSRRTIHDLSSNYPFYFLLAHFDRRWNLTA